MNTISLRIAGAQDAPQLVALINAAFSVERFFVTGEINERLEAWGVGRRLTPDQGTP